MKSINLLISLIAPLLLGQFLSCSSLHKTKLAEYPGFEKDAQRFIITSPFSHYPSGSNQFVVEHRSADTTFQVKTRFEDRKVDKTNNRESFSYKFYVGKPFNEGYYEVIGNTTILRSEDNRTRHLVTPLEFLIFADGREVGRITHPKTGFFDLLMDPKYNFDVLIQDKQLQVEYQPIKNNRNMAVENAQGLLALMHSKPTGFISTKQKGNFLIKAGLQKELKSDLLTTYMIVESVVGIISASLHR